MEYVEFMVFRFRKDVVQPTVKMGESFSDILQAAELPLRIFCQDIFNNTLTVAAAAASSRPVTTGAIRTVTGTVRYDKRYNPYLSHKREVSVKAFDFPSRLIPDR